MGLSGVKKFIQDIWSLTHNSKSWFSLAHSVSYQGHLAHCTYWLIRSTSENSLTSIELLDNQSLKSLSFEAASIIAGQISSILIKFEKNPDNSTSSLSNNSIASRAAVQLNIIDSSSSSQSSSSSAILFQFTSFTGLYVTVNLWDISSLHTPLIESTSALYHVITGLSILNSTPLQ